MNRVRDKVMSAMLQPPIDPREPGRSADEVDGLLHSFFQSELPRSWPPFRMPPPRLRSATAWRPRMRSALALAASVTILVLSLGLVPGKLAERSIRIPRGSDNSATNTTKDAPRPSTMLPEKR
jgi:hypothetical protein